MVDNTDETFGGYLDRKNFIMGEIGKSFTRQVAEKTINRSVNVTSMLNIICGTESENGTPLCPQCIKLYFPDPAEEIRTNGRANIDRITQTACSGLCYCAAKNITFDQNITINSAARIDDSDVNIQEIAKNVTDAVRERYGETSTKNEFNQNIVDIVTQIKTQAVTNVNQVISSLQNVTIVGTGEVSNLNLGISIDATMMAIASSNVAIDILNNIVNKQMEYIREQVDKNVVGGFTQAFKEAKRYLIITGIVLIGLMLLISGLLIYRARFGHKTSK